MSDIDLTVLVDRSALGLAPLNLNDGVLYKIGKQLLGGQLAWERTTISSPYVHGEETVHRRMQNVQEPLSVEVFGRTTDGALMTNSTLQQNMATLWTAFQQDAFTVTVLLDDAIYTYQCEAAEMQVTWLGTRFTAKQGEVNFTVPRKPLALAGGV